MPTMHPGIALDHEHLKGDSLIEVLPVGISNQHNKLNIVLKSVEAYEAGFIANFVIEVSVEIPRPNQAGDNPEYPPELRGFIVATEATDEHGNRYTGYFRAGFGGGRTDGVTEMFAVHAFEPALSPDATTLTFVFHHVERLGFAAEGGHDLVNTRHISDPWQVSFNVRSDQQVVGDSFKVIPVGSSVRVAGAEVAILAIENTRFGLQITSRLDWVGTPGQMPQITWSAIDDLGATYRSNNCGGSGGGAPDEFGNEVCSQSWRMQCLFAKPIDPAATQLTLRIEKIDLQLPYWDESDPEVAPEWIHDQSFNDLGVVVIDLN